MVWSTNPDSGKSSVAALILAAGYSFRMKSFKPLLPLGSVPVVEKAVRSFADAGFRDIRVVLGHKGAELLPVCESLGVRNIINDHFAEGMFSSVQAGVRSMNREVKGFFLLPVDNPLIHGDTLNRLYEVFRRGQQGIVYPVYRGERGHPPLISSRYFEPILGWSGEGGLRALLERYPRDGVEVPVDDQGVLLDMDTPEDYRTLLKYQGCTQLPTEQECYGLLNAHNTPPRVVKHAEQVARVCAFLGRQLNQAGCSLNLELMRSAALLHDIAKLKGDHAGEGAKITAHYPEVSSIIATHMDIQWDPAQPLTEKEIVYLADKLVNDDQVVSLGERFAKALERHKNEPEVLAQVCRRFDQSAKIFARVEGLLGESLELVYQFKRGRDANG